MTIVAKLSLKSLHQDHRSHETPSGPGYAYQYLADQTELHQTFFALLKNSNTAVT